jgi:hypothetical protein
MPANPANFEERLAVAVEAYQAIVAADAWLALAPAVPVIIEEQGDIANKIATALAKLGLCVVIVAADADELEERGATLRLRCRLVAQISEKVLLNKAACAAAGIAYRPARSAALRIMKAVHRKPNGLDTAGARHVPGLNEFTLLTDRPFELLRNPTDVVYQVNVTTWIDL